MKFPYQEFRVKPTPEFPKGVLYRPRIPFLAIGPIGELRLDGLVDTGSDQTILPRTDLADIGVTVNAKQQSRVRGRLPHYEDNVTRAENIRFALQLDGETYIWPAEVWLGTDETPALLGHSGFLEYFIATFNGATRELDLKPTKSFPGKAIKLWE